MKLSAMSVPQLGAALDDFGVMGFGIAQSRAFAGMTGDDFDIADVRARLQQIANECPSGIVWREILGKLLVQAIIGHR